MDSIAKYNVITGAYIGEGGMRSLQYDRATRLKQQAHTDELFALVNDPRPIVRAYAFLTLRERPVNLIDVVKAHLYDTALVESADGCFVTSTMVADLFLGNFHDLMYSPDTDEYAVNYQKVKALYDTVLYKPGIKLQSKISIIMSINGDPAYYDRIRQIADKERMPEAVLALAKYRKQEDKDIIASYFTNEKTQYFALRAVKKFPDSSFYPHLVSLFEQEWRNRNYDHPLLRELYQALALFPTDKTIELFERTIHSKKKYHRENSSTLLYIAIMKYPHPRFEKYKVIQPTGLYEPYVEQEIKAD